MDDLALKSESFLSPKRTCEGLRTPVKHSTQIPSQAESKRQL